MLFLRWAAALSWAVSVATAYPQQYANFYAMLLRPEQLYVEAPSFVAPFHPPWPVDNPEPTLDLYVRELFRHPAYVSPDIGDDLLDYLHANILWVLRHPYHERARADQLEMLRSMETAGVQARHEIASALHPVNVEAQHIAALRSLEGRLGSYMHLIRDQDKLDRVTNRLNQFEKDRFLRSHRHLVAERALINAAMPLASTVPHRI